MGALKSFTDFSAEASQRASLPCPAFERTVLTQLYHGKKLFQYLGVAPPIVIMLTLTGMKGWRIATQHSGSVGRFDRDPVFIPDLVLETFDGINRDEVKPILDIVWNAAGSPGSPNYDAHGKRKADDT